MKRMIYQVYTGASSRLYDHCVGSVKDYCEQYDIDHIVQTFPKMKIKPDVFRTNRSKESYEKYGGFLPIYEKENAFDYWDKYDQICIVDADIWIRPGSPNIFDELKPDTDFAGMIEKKAPIKDWYKQKLLNYSRMQYGGIKNVNWYFDETAGCEFFNMGLMLMNKSITKYLRGDTGKEFIQRPEFKDFVDGMGPWKWSTDQTLLNYWVRNEKMNLQYLDFKWNALYSAVNHIQKAHFVHFFLKDKLPNKGENVEQLMKDVQ